jgi:hypothetical protein
MQKPILQSSAVALAAMLVIAGHACASAPQPVAGTSGGGSEAEHHRDTHHMHYNHVAAFVGGTTLNKGGTHFTLGGDYVRYLPHHPRLGIGAFGEAIFAEHTEWAIGALLVYRVVEQLGIRVGPGLEILQEEAVEHPTSKSASAAAPLAEHETRTKAEFLFRIGVGYDLELGGVSITPTIDFDIIRGSSDAFVWGINVGTGF